MAKKKLPRTYKRKLSAAIKLIRKHVRGYEASEGYSIKEVEAMPARRRARLIKKAATLQELLRTPHDIIAAKTRRERHALYQFTKQRLRKAKHYIAHKPSEAFKIRVARGRIQVRGRFQGQRIITESEYYLFPRKPRYPKELVAMTRRLLKEMKPGYYVLLTAAHGDTGEPFDRESVIARLNEYLAAYEVDSEGKPTGFSEALVGFRFMATTLDGMLTQKDTIDARRARVKAQNEKARQAERKADRKARRKK